MKTQTPLFTPRPDGAYDIQPAGVILILADTIYGADKDDCTPTGRARAMDALASLFAAARAGGFTQGDILMTLLVRGEVSQRVKTMAVQACAAAGDKAIDELFATLRSKGKR